MTKLSTCLAACALAACAAAVPLPAPAQGADTTVVGTAQSTGKRTVSFAALSADATPAAREFLATLRNDLAISGWFVPTDAPQASVILSGSVRGSSYGVDASVSASWNLRASSQSWQRRVSAATLRDEAHAVADDIVRRVAGKEPMASSKILCVGRRGGATDVYECDADGGRLRCVTGEGRLCLSPNWEPGRNSFLYTSWNTGRPIAYRIDLATNRRTPVSAFPGMNQGATLSPDGSRAAIVLSRSGTVDLYLVDPATRRPADRLTRSKANESSPSWSPDGRSIVYASDEGGYPRCYVMDLASRAPRRLVWSSSIRENVAPEWGPDGRIVFCGRSGGRYGIYVADPSGNTRTAVLKPVSPADGADYEDPSWAPDGRHVVCTRTAGYRRSLVVLDTEGDPARKLFDVPGDWYLPSWSDNAVAAPAP